jgi:hypothetical protein
LLGKYSRKKEGKDENEREEVEDGEKGLQENVMKQAAFLDG